jgi:ABC-type spermidine/putrescine transport system permease subunit I
VSYAAVLLFAACAIALAAMFSGKFISFGEGQKPMSDEELDRAQLNAFYREIISLLLGIALGASLFCLFAGYSIAHFTH